MHVCVCVCVCVCVYTWTQNNHLMKALLEAILLYKHQLLYDTYYI